LDKKTYENGWAFGVNITSPRMFADTYNENFDFGGGLSLVADLDEMNTLRLKAQYNKFTSITGPTGLTKAPSTQAVGLGIDYLMTLNPFSKTLKVYGGVGLSVLGYKVENPVNTGASETRIGEVAMNVTLGARYDFTNNIAAVVELGHHTVSTDKFDGIMGPLGGIFGGTLDSYVSLNIGAQFYFSRGPEIKKEETPHGMEIDYNKIEQMIKDAQTKPAPAPEVNYKKIEDIVKEQLKNLPKNNEYKPEEKKPDVKKEDQIDHDFTFHSVYFDVNSAEIKPEFKLLLDKNAEFLNNNPNVKIQIIGNTDSSGDPEKNRKLSERRATSARDYLAKKGVSKSRMTIVAAASSNPIGSNDTAEGKSLNRRVDFKIVK